MSQLEPKWLEPKWLESKWLEPKWLRTYIYIYIYIRHRASAQGCVRLSFACLFDLRLFPFPEVFLHCVFLYVCRCPVCLSGCLDLSGCLEESILRGRTPQFPLGSGSVA